MVLPNFLLCIFSPIFFAFQIPVMRSQNTKKPRNINAGNIGVNTAKNNSRTLNNFVLIRLFMGIYWFGSFF